VGSEQIKTVHCQLPTARFL